MVRTAMTFLASCGTHCHALTVATFLGRYVSPTVAHLPQRPNHAGQHVVAGHADGASGDLLDRAGLQHVGGQAQRVTPDPVLALRGQQDPFAIQHLRQVQAALLGRLGELPELGASGGTDSDAVSHESPAMIALITSSTRAPNRMTRTTVFVNSRAVLARDLRSR